VKLRRTGGSCVDGYDVDYVAVIGCSGKLIRKRRLIHMFGAVVGVDVYDVTAIACSDLSHAGV
jgi:hypothetical protein